MVTRLTNYTKQFWILLSTDDMDTLGSHNGDEAIVIDRDERYVFDEENRIWRQIPMSGGGGGGVTVTSLTVTENGTYTAPSGTAYSPVAVDVVSKDTETLKSLVERTITTIHLDVSSTGPSSCSNCGNLETAVFPKATIHYGTSLSNCGNLRSVDTSATNIYTNCFMNDSALSSLVLRANSVCAIANVNVLGNTPFASGKSGGTLYVPSALIASYQAATNWSTILGYPDNQIKAIEGSIYETQYVDGTPIA
jgi:hypothetical protein